MPKIARALTANELRKFSKKIGEYAVGGDGCSGLFLRVQRRVTDISAAYVLRRRTKSINLKKSFGTFEEITAEQARAKAREWNALIAAGVDPRGKEAQEAEANRRAAEAAANAALSIGALLPQFYEHQLANGKIRKGNRDEGEREVQRHMGRFRNHVPELLKLSAVKCTAKDIAAALLPIWCRPRETADKVQAQLLTFFTWLETVKELRPDGSNPATMKKLRPLLPAEALRDEPGHFASLEPDQVPPFMRALNEKTAMGFLCLRFAVLTCARSENVREMRWDQLNEDRTLWTLDAKDMKSTENGQHLVPLSPQAQALIRRLEANKRSETYVFPSPRGDKPLSSSALLGNIKALDRKATERGEEGWIDRKQTAAAMKAGEPNPRRVTTQHALCRTAFETWAQERREDDRAIKLCLHHSLGNTLGAAYDRATTLPLKRELLERWAAFCFSAIDGAE